MNNHAEKAYIALKMENGCIANAKGFQSKGWKAGARDYIEYANELKMEAKNSISQAKIYEDIAKRVNNEGAEIFSGCVKEHQGDEDGMKGCFKDRFKVFEEDCMGYKQIIVAEHSVLKMDDIL